MIRPYYETNGVTLFHGDCREILPQLSGFDVVIADPPYGETSLEWDRWPTGWVDAVSATGARTLWCFGSMRMFLDRRDDFAGWHMAQDLVWEKHNGSGFHADRFKRVHEHAVQWYRGPWEAQRREVPVTLDAVKRTVRKKGRPAHMGHIDATPFVSEDGGPRLMRSVIFARSRHGVALHPTEKPAAFVTHLVTYSVAPGAIVVDPFVGSGTTLEVARNTGRVGVGIEIDEAKCEIAARRLAQGILALGGA